MPPVRECLGCGRDIPLGTSRCDECKRAQRRARRHPGYDDPTYRRARREAKRSTCERCHRAPAAIVHHDDGDPGHNERSNYTYACGTCAVALDNEMRAARRGRNR